MSDRDDSLRRLCDFIRSSRDALIADWAERVRKLPPARELSPPALVDHLPEVLARLADIVESVHTGKPVPLAEAPKKHAIDRLARGFDLDEVIKEFSVLRQCILALWERNVGATITVSELRLLDSALDQSISDSCVSFARARERMLRAVDRISEAALGTADLEAFLQKILQATLETTEAVDTAVVFLREGEVLRMRAAVGMEEEVARGFTVKVGEDVAGKVAADAMPILLRNAAADPLVHSQTIREKGIRALYAVPLSHAGSVIGVAYMGSRTAYEFSEEDKLLFRTMASRATSVIVQARLIAELENIVSSQKRDEERLRFLSEASRRLAESIDYETTLSQIARLVLPAIADWFAVDLLRDGEISSIVVAHADPEKVKLAKEYRRRFPTELEASRGLAKVLREGKPELYEDVSDEVLVTRSRSDEHFATMRELGMRSAMIVPLKVRGRTVGALSFVSAGSGRRYDRSDLEMAQGLADRAAMPIENARLFREAERASRLREEVLAVVSHDLRNPLSSINMSAALLFKKSATDARTRKQLETILRATGRMEHLIGDLLDMASIQAGRLAVERATREIAPIIAEAVEMAEPLAKATGQTLSSEIAVGAARCSVDRERVLQLLSNLLGNAKKFCPAGGSIIVRASVKGSEVECSVSDTGPGIPAKDLPHVFDPYWSGKQHTKKGVGLGLYISKGIVEAHGGRIWVENQVGVGATFHFTLPLA